MYNENNLQQRLNKKEVVVSKKVKKYEGFEIDSSCADVVDVHFFEGDSIWRTIFPKFTTMYAFDTNEKKKHHCNLLILYTLYKNFEETKNEEKKNEKMREKLWEAYNSKKNDEMMREKLWESYNSEENKKSIKNYELLIQKKWNEEKCFKEKDKTITCPFPITNMESIKTHILSETYSLSLMDMIIFCDYHKIPVVFFTRSNKTESNKMKNRFIKTYNMTNKEDGGENENKGFYYYIRIKQHSAKKGIIFSILFYKKDIKLNNNIFGIPEEKYREREKNEKMIEKRLELIKKIRHNKVKLEDYLENNNYNSFIGISDDYKTINPWIINP